MRMFSGDSLEEVFCRADIEDSWKRVLFSGGNVGEAQKKECFQKLCILRDYFLNTIIDIKDPQDKESCFVLMYVFSRVQWILLHTRIHYTVNTPRFDVGLRYEAEMLSTLIGAMEERIPAGKVQFITQILLRSVEDLEQEGDWDPEALEKNNLGGLYERIKALESQVTERDERIQQFETEWSLLEAGVGKRSARGILETVRELKDLLLTGTQSAPAPLPERYQDFDREFGGLSAHHIAGQLARFKELNGALEREAQRWQEDQALLLRELGEADAARLVSRFREMQDTITRLSVGAPLRAVPEETIAESDSIDELLLGISSVLSEMNA